MADVHPSALLEGDIHLADEVVIGPGCVLRGRIEVQAGCTIIGNAWLQGPLTLGKGNVVYPFVCLGFAPQHTAVDPNTDGAGVVIGKGNTFREHVTVHRAMKEQPTTIGNSNYFMGSSHVGHDGIVGNNCTLVQGSTMGGHAQLADRVVLSGGAGVHQFCRVGRGGMIGRGAGVSSDVPPWFTVTATNLAGAVNVVGLRRSGASKEDIDDVRWVYRMLYRSGLPFRSALAALQERAERPFVAESIAFIEAAKRPICGGPAKRARARGESGLADDDG
ncbi:MAG: acyl-ACP--UDP-N-acetylglucosamine O-acyltransferase [Phycisphaerales bacterium]